ncbi:Membrane protein involved in the export of O-antigen and teichoic acid [Muriicola jejuensis]|uniref:Sugar isomerase n=1 Tax=Muriicola jejuensis TaxID=504488 RepID=A0A6P0UIH4_9FLAO|nr:sugar isomerase [Muriicola jejuensis]NER11599.1 sugar isomerase [Muriicola jejuensis]SMP19360.1 Membrane protein involved in the export of O-antigen and teichoic acid [Muriicola jejuensis]
MTAFKLVLKKVTPEQLFMGSVLLVNGGNYLYNLLLGRMLGPEAYADAALLVTLLLVLSFLGMTFQLATTKFAVIFSGTDWESFRNRTYKQAIAVGTGVAAILIYFAKELQALFHTSSPYMFVALGFVIPLYFVMSVNRGTYQGKQSFNSLSMTYQTEMWSRLLITLAFVLFSPLDPGISVALGIAFSFLFGLIPSNFKGISLARPSLLNKQYAKRVNRFIFLTLGYEITQIIINNSDVLMVKHYFEAGDAGLYASLALIGRVVYFVAWMFVMLLLPDVVRKEKNGEATTPVLFRYVGYVILLSLSIITACSFFPELIIQLMFGEAYVSMAGLLWQYALATSLFAVGNIFTYYFLSLDRYFPVIISGVLGLSQIAAVGLFHNSLEQVVQVQIGIMLMLLASQLLFFFLRKREA